MRRCGDCGSIDVVTPFEADNPDFALCQACVDLIEASADDYAREHDAPCHFLTETVPQMIQQAHLEWLGWLPSAPSST